MDAPQIRLLGNFDKRNTLFANAEGSTVLHSRRLRSADHRFIRNARSGRKMVSVR